MLKTVIDSNVIISAISFRGIPRKVLNLVIRGKITNYISEDILYEIKDVLQRPKFNYDSLIIKLIIQELEHISEFTDSSMIADFINLMDNKLRDKDDNHVIACARAAGADYLITGDNDLLTLKNTREIQIVTPSRFMTIIK